LVIEIRSGLGKTTFRRLGDRHRIVSPQQPVCQRGHGHFSLAMGSEFGDNHPLNSSISPFTGNLFMSIRSQCAALSFLFACVFATLSHAQENSATKTGSDKNNSPLVPKPTVKVQKGPLAASVTVKGTVTGETTTELSVRMKAWSGPLIVEQAVEHGALVKKGDVLLTFDAEKLSQSVASAREERALAGLTIRLAELELPLLKQQLPLDLLAAERDKQQAADELQRFLKVEKPRQVEEARFAVKSSEFSALSAKDELTQLEKMYRDKDLTEETEQMILKRYRFSLESAEFYLQGTRLRTERSLNIDLPRREEASHLAAARSELAWQRAREQLPLQVRQKELALEKLRFDDHRAQERLADLEHDLTMMTVKAPAAGVVYFGRYVRGQWSGPQATAFLKGGTLPANDVVLTIIPNGRLFLHAEVDEKEAGDLKVGQVARFSPARSPRKKLGARVHRVAAVPRGGQFEMMVALTDEDAAGLVPGLTGLIRIVTAQKENVLTVPSTAVFDDPDSDSNYVYLPGQTPQKKVVKIGLVAGDKTEIVEGLAEGDEILAGKP
jgi:multidrug resistance efflux pump